MSAKYLPSGHVTLPIPKTDAKDKLQNFHSFKLLYGDEQHLMRVYPGRWLLPSTYHKYSERICNLKVKKDDVIVMSFPRSGTTWMAEIVWTMINNPNLDHLEQDLTTCLRTFWIEEDMFMMEDTPIPNILLQRFMTQCPNKSLKEGLMLTLIEETSGRRVMKTNLPFSFFKNSINSSKVIYLLRDPKDVFVSWEKHSRIDWVYNFVGTFPQFLECFLGDDVMFGPYWNHVEEAWNRKDLPNLLLIRYEDLLNKPELEYRRIRDFIRPELTSKQLDMIAEHTSFDVMKARELGLTERRKSFPPDDISKEEFGFFRKGKCGYGKNSLSLEQNAKFDLWVQLNMKKRNLNLTSKLLS